MSDKPENVDPNVERNIQDSDTLLKKRATKDDKRPSYQMRGDSAIPVAKHTGKLWESRINAAKTKRENTGVQTAWDEALKYFNNDQLDHRTEGHPDRAGNRARATKLGETFTETENVVFANVAAQVPVLYAKNPRVEVTTFKKNNEEAQKRATMCERLLNVLFARKAAPGINLKPKARRCVVMCSLTNSAWLEVGYTRKSESGENTLEELRTLSKQLAKAKSEKEIKELEGKLMALEDKIDVLRPSGPWAKFRKPHQVVIDPTAVELDGEDAKWMAVYDYVPCSFILAVYGDKAADDQFKSIYKPSHILKVNAKKGSDGGAEHDDVSFSLFQKDAGYGAYGYETEEAFKAAQYMKVWYVWDKVTRRVMLYNDADWKWPIWVWDDPYQLDCFFPFVPLSFYTNPEGGEAQGEVTYYLDQQDAINEIIDEERRARAWARRNIFFDTNKISKDDAEKVLKGTDEMVVGVDVPEGQTINDCVWSMVPPSMRFTELFDVERKLRAVDRISSTTDMMRGVQFKTNTTNKAIESYQATTQTRVDEKIDAIEDMIGQVGWLVLQLVLQNMEKEEVERLIGEGNADLWAPMTAEAIASEFSVTIVGGSAQKPTSKMKKEEALQLGQVLGQFADVSPMVVQVMLKVMESAFDEITMTEEMWAFVRESIFGKLQEQQNGGTGDGGTGNAGIEQGLQALAQLPPEAQRAIAKAVERGVPLADAIVGVIQQLQGGGGGGPQQQQPQQSAA